jgi:hypothetical protein
MKITRKELRKLIEGSVRKRGDYVIPVEDPIEDPIAGLDYSDEQKPKVKMMAMSDDEQNQEHANFIADIGGHEDDGRFGAETFSKKVQAYDLDVNLLKKDMDLDSAMTNACEFWIYERKDNLSYFDHIDQDNSKKYADYMIEMYGGDQAVANEIKVHTTAVLDERIKKLIKISNSAAPVPSVDEKVAKYENAKKLFSTDHNNPIVEDHILFKFRSVLYPFYLDWKSYYEKEQGYDFSDPEHVARYEKNIAMFKEGKVRLTRRKLRKLIESYVVDDKGNVVSAADAYDIGLDTAAAAIDKSRAKSGKSPIGQTLVRSSDPETVTQGLGFADALDAEYSDFERTAVDMPDDDKQPNIPMSKLDGHMKAKYGQGQAMGEVYSLVVRDNMGKEVLIPIIDDHSEEEKKRGEGIPEDTMYRILDAYRKMEKARMILRSLPDIDDEDDETYKANDPIRFRAFEMFEEGEGTLEHFYWNDLLSDHVHEVLSYPPYNYSYQNAKNFELLRIEPRHKELEDALTYASGMEWMI